MSDIVLIDENGKATVDGRQLVEVLLGDLLDKEMELVAKEGKDPKEYREKRILESLLFLEKDDPEE